MHDKPKSIERKEIEDVLGAGPSKTSRLRGRTFLAALIILAAGAGYWAWTSASTGGAESDLVYVTRPAAVATITTRITATGAVQPTNQVEISSELSGTVREVHVDFNSVVKAGEALATLDQVKLIAATQNSRARLAAARSALKEAEVNLEERASNWDRKRKLSEAAMTATERDTARADWQRALVLVESAKANIQANEAQLRLDETNLVRSRIVSPIDGVVLMRKVDPGQTVASSFQAPVLFTIAEDLSRMEVQVDVDEADVGGVKEGQNAIFTVDAFPGKRFDARIGMVRYGSEVVQGVVTYKAVLVTDNSDLLLRPGMTATAEIVVQEVKDALTVPNQALRFAPPQPGEAAASRGFIESLLPGRPRFRPASAPRAQSGKRVYVLRDGRPVAIPVAAGLSDERVTQIVKGDLKPGDEVIIDTARKR